MGADREVKSDFQPIAGTNRDLGERVAQGRFRDDLLARIDLWTFRLPGLRERREDIEPNLDFELERAAWQDDRMRARKATRGGCAAGDDADGRASRRSTDIDRASAVARVEHERADLASPSRTHER